MVSLWTMSENQTLSSRMQGEMCSQKYAKSQSVGLFLGTCEHCFLFKHYIWIIPHIWFFMISKLFLVPDFMWSSQPQNVADQASLSPDKTDEAHQICSLDWPTSGWVVDMRLVENGARTKIRFLAPVSCSFIRLSCAHIQFITCSPYLTQVNRFFTSRD